MIITCPSCSTHYSVAPAVIGAGKTVRCHNCQNSWHQVPVAERPPARTAPARRARMPRAAAIMAGMAPMAVAPMAAAPMAAPMAAPPPPPPPPPPPMPEMATAPPKEDKPLNQTELDSMFGPPPPPPPASVMDAGATPQAAPDSAQLSQEDLDKVMAQPEPEAVASVAAEEPAPAEEPPTDIENLREPEPIPGALAPDAEAAEPRRRGWAGPIAAAAGVLLLIGAGAGLYFGRDMVMRMVPFTKEVYSMLGLGKEALGAGLDIRSVASERVNEGGVEVLAVRGVVVNISSVERMVPFLRVALFDANNRMVQSTDAPPAKERLAPAGEIGFRIGLRDPSPLARRLEVTFVEGTMSPDGAAPGAPKQ